MAFDDIYTAEEREFKETYLVNQMCMFERKISPLFTIISGLGTAQISTAFAIPWLGYAAGVLLLIGAIWLYWSYHSKTIFQTMMDERWTLQQQNAILDSLNDKVNRIIDNDDESY